MRAKHPAPYSKPVLEAMKNLMLHEARIRGIDLDELRILDPMAGTGRIHEIGAGTVGIEIEPEWAEYHPRTEVGDALRLPFPNGSFQAIGVSPTYGNRFADHHEAKDPSRRRGYKFDLGRMPTEGSSAVMAWGLPYLRFHEQAWAEATRVLEPGALFVLNVSDIIKDKRVIPVVAQHVKILFDMDYRLVWATTVSTQRMRYGANREARVDGEQVIAMRAPT